MVENESVITDYQAELNELNLRMEQVQANENIIEREEALNALMEDYWFVEALLAELLK